MGDDWRHREDSLRVGRGIVYGVLFGVLLWAVMIGFVVFVIFR